MKKLTLSVISVEGVSLEVPIYCEIEFKSQTFRTRVIKNKTNWDQTFTIGSFNVSDSLNIRCVAKRSTDILGELTIELGEFAADGQYDKQLSSENGCSFNLKFQVEKAPHRSISRSPSMQLLRDTLSKLPFMTRNSGKGDDLVETVETKIEIEPSGQKRSSIKQSQSHMTGLDKVQEKEKEKEAALTIDRTLSEEQVSEISKPRRERRRRKRDTVNPEKELSDPSNITRSKSKSITPGTEDDITSNKPFESPSAGRRRKRTERASDKTKQQDSESTKKEKLIKPKKPKSEKVKSEESTKDRPLDGNSNSNETTDNNVQQDSGAKIERRKTVILQPIGGNNFKIFGTPLEEVMTSQKETRPELNIPIFFDIAGRIIRDRGKSLKGIFRVRGGKLSEVKQLKEKIDHGETFDEENVNVHIITTLLKAFLRELPVPVLTFENYYKFINCSALEGAEQIEALRSIMQSLPRYNYDLVKFLTELLYELSLQADETQMTAESLAKVIAPNLVWKKEVDLSDLSMVDDATKGNEVAQVLIVNSEQIFQE